MKPLLLLLILSGCAQDKVAHFVMGAGASAVTDLVFPEPINLFGLDIPTGCIAAVGLGLAKEYRDSKTGGTVEAMDAAATAAGGCSVTLLRFGINKTMAN